MSTLSGLISAGGGGALPQIFLTQSQTWVPPQDGNVCIHVIGAGSGGAYSTSASRINSGGAGGYCKKNSLAVTTGGSFTVVVGVGGAGRVGAYGVGPAGGASTVAGTGLSSTLTANGGGQTGDPYSSSTQGPGGSAANGDVNNTGGAGLYNAGGGAVGIYGTGATGSTYHRAGQTDARGGGLQNSGFGHICGGIAGRLSGGYLNPSSMQGTSGGGDLCGGGQVYINNNSLIQYGGDAGIGGGGGGIRVSALVNYAGGGNGGDGIVIIQYLPS